MKENELYKYRNDCEKQDRKLDIHFVAMSSQDSSFPIQKSDLTKKKKKKKD